ncbi:MAG: hypothetical protein HQL32_03990, partial [Planctomycetes bacterium]|nr:hypothetical protein [Planctomycetota bacterium]
MHQFLYLYYHSAHHLFDRPARVLDLLFIWLHFKKAQPKLTPAILTEAKKYGLLHFVDLSLEMLRILDPDNQLELPPRQSRRVLPLAQSLCDNFPGQPKKYALKKFSLVQNPLRAIAATLSPSRLIYKKWG